MSKHQAAERKFNAQRRLAHGGDTIPPYPKLISPLRSSGFFSTAKNFFQKVGTCLLPDKSIKNSSPVSHSRSVLSLITSLLAFLPTISADSMKYFSINGSHYAVLPKGNVNWINGSCGALMESSGIAGEKIMSICTVDSTLFDWATASPIYAGLNTTVNITSALKCLEQLAQKQCDDAEYPKALYSTLVVMNVVAGALVLCVACLRCMERSGVSRGISSRLRPRTSADDEPSLPEPYQRLTGSVAPEPGAINV